MSEQTSIKETLRFAVLGLRWLAKKGAARLANVRDWHWAWVRVGAFCCSIAIGLVVFLAQTSPSPTPLFGNSSVSQWLDDGRFETHGVPMQVGACPALPGSGEQRRINSAISDPWVGPVGLGGCDGSTFGPVDEFVEDATAVYRGQDRKAHAGGVSAERELALAKTAERWRSGRFVQGLRVAILSAFAGYLAGIAALAFRRRLSPNGSAGGALGDEWAFFHATPFKNWMTVPLVAELVGFWFCGAVFVGQMAFGSLLHFAAERSDWGAGVYAQLAPGDAVKLSGKPVELYVGAGRAASFGDEVDVAIAREQTYGGLIGVFSREELAPDLPGAKFPVWIGSWSGAELTRGDLQASLKAKIPNLPDNEEKAALEALQIRRGMLLDSPLSVGFAAEVVILVVLFGLTLAAAIATPALSAVGSAARSATQTLVAAGKGEALAIAEREALSQAAEQGRRAAKKSQNETGTSPDKKISATQADLPVRGAKRL